MRPARPDATSTPQNDGRAGNIGPGRRYWLRQSLSGADVVVAGCGWRCQPPTTSGAATADRRTPKRPADHKTTGAPEISGSDVAIGYGSRFQGAAAVIAGCGWRRHPPTPWGAATDDRRTPKRPADQETTGAAEISGSGVAFGCGRCLQGAADAGSGPIGSGGGRPARWHRQRIRSAGLPRSGRTPRAAPPAPGRQRGRGGPGPVRANAGDAA
ncbi:MAG: hypothetical protein AVDCRST_MAG83-798 [uncultured Arthrobacter sp.]|uniref:Uncharacterized protein n=1 Tax=uncultured Arthrobacter sp. TaxID=114050 RepID=A0A6J4HLE4_9MICC|nr:MAG: hypothetical protein AVDCRST_MAG83-798 [uncultured Arthrobacter sp.]